MADYSVTPASVLKGTSSGVSIKTATAGATILQGQALYKDSADNKLKLADCNSVTAGIRVVEGIALSAAANGQPVTYVTADDALTPGFTLPAGEVVVLSGTAGGLKPDADSAPGDYKTIVGVGVGSNKMMLILAYSGVAVPA